MTDAKPAPLDQEPRHRLCRQQTNLEPGPEPPAQSSTAPTCAGTEPRTECEGESLQLRTYRMHLAKLDLSCRAISSMEPVARQVGELRNFVRQVRNLEVRVRACEPCALQQDLLEQLARRQGEADREAEDLAHQLRREASSPLRRASVPGVSCTLSDAVDERLSGLARRLDVDPGAARMASLRAKARHLDEAQASVAKVPRTAAKDHSARLSAELARVHGALASAGNLACDLRDVRTGVQAARDGMDEQRAAWRTLQGSVGKIRKDMGEEQAFFGHLGALYRTGHEDLGRVHEELGHSRELAVKCGGLTDAVVAMKLRGDATCHTTQERAIDWGPVVRALVSLSASSDEANALHKRLTKLEGERNDFADTLADMDAQFKKFNRFGQMLNSV